MRTGLLVFGLAAAASVAGCSDGFRDRLVRSETFSTTAPVPEGHSLEFQREIASARHWWLSAERAAADLSSQFPAIDAGKVSVIPDGPPTTFSEVYNGMLAAELDALGYDVATGPGGELLVTHRVRVIGREASVDPASATAHLGGVGLTAAQAGAAANPVGALAAGAAASVLGGASVSTPESEAALLVDVTRDGDLVASHREIFYLSEGQVGHFLPDRSGEPKGDLLEVVEP